MKKVYFGVFKFKNIIINACIILLLGIITAVAFIGGNESLITSTTNGAYYHGNRSNNCVSLMVNVYWGTEYIEDMLEVFEQKQVKTTFFLGGIWVLENEELVNKIVEKGHEIANHGYKHKSQDKVSREESIKEIETTHQLINKLTGINMNLFAPPSGAYNDQTIEVASELGYKTIMWSRDTIDWRDHNSELIYSRAVKEVKGGDLILMHPTQETLNALPSIIDTILEKRLVIGTVSNCIGA